jgi:hypothetical protein
VGVVGRKPLCVLESSFIRSPDAIGFYAAQSVNNILLLARYMPLKIGVRAMSYLSRQWLLVRR